MKRAHEQFSNYKMDEDNVIARTENSYVFYNLIQLNEIVIPEQDHYFISSFLKINDDKETFCLLKKKRKELHYSLYSF